MLPQVPRAVQPHRLIIRPAENLHDLQHALNQESFRLVKLIYRTINVSIPRPSFILYGVCLGKQVEQNESPARLPAGLLRLILVTV